MRKARLSAEQVREAAGDAYDFITTNLDNATSKVWESHKETLRVLDLLSKGHRIKP